MSVALLPFSTCIELLIAPEGIEITSLQPSFLLFSHLLIAPEGIEIHSK